VERRSLPDKVFEQLLSEIVSGRYPPEATVPSERQLGETLGVNRHVVREAIKRLEQIGLVRVTQGGRTTVLDFQKTAGLDLLALVAEHAEAAGALSPLLAAALEMRAGIGVDLARLCAQRAGGEVGKDLLEISQKLAAAGGEELLELDRRFWQRVLDGAGNLAYQLAFNSLIRAVHAQRDLSIPWLEQELGRSDYRRPIAVAIAAAEADTAASAAREALTAPEDAQLFRPARSSRGGR
jgi:DNA-binding FadR family transcriptional regulator